MQDNKTPNCCFCQLDSLSGLACALSAQVCVVCGGQAGVGEPPAAQVGSK